MNIETNLTNLIPFLVPLLILQFGLLIWALVDIFKRDTYRFGNRILWIIICLAINTIGPIIYLTLGRGEKRD